MSKKQRLAGKFVIMRRIANLTLDDQDLVPKLPLGDALAGKLCFRLKRATSEAELHNTLVPKQELGNKLLAYLTLDDHAHTDVSF